MGRRQPPRLENENETAHGARRTACRCARSLGVSRLPRQWRRWGRGRGWAGQVGAPGAAGPSWAVWLITAAAINHDFIVHRQSPSALALWLECRWIFLNARYAGFRLERWSTSTFGQHALLARLTLTPRPARPICSVWWARRLSRTLAKFGIGGLLAGANPILDGWQSCFGRFVGQQWQFRQWFVVVGESGAIGQLLGGSHPSAQPARSG